MSTARDPAIETTGLVKKYKSGRAVDGLDLVVPRGGVFGLLGPNGAGKTTTIRILATLVRPDGGTARVFGHDVVTQARQVRRRISLTGQFASIDEDLTGAENLIVLSRLHGHPHARAKAMAGQLLAGIGLDAVGGKPVKTYSGGMRRRLDIAAGVIVPRDLLFLDEPTTGLDPASRNQVWQTIRELAEKGTTIVLTTQYLEEADQLAGRLVVIDKGRVIAQGTPAELKARVGAATLQVRVDDRGHCHEAGRLLADALGTSVHTESAGDTLSARITDPAHAPFALARLADAGIGLAAFQLARPSLDEVFLTLTGHTAKAPTEAAI